MAVSGVCGCRSASDCGGEGGVSVVGADRGVGW